jgi:hypothetical protein
MPPALVLWFSFIGRFCFLFHSPFLHLAPIARRQPLAPIARCQLLAPIAR